MTSERKRQRWGLKGKLITAMLLVGAAPLLIGLGMAFLQGTRELHEAAGASFASLAAESARSLDLVFSDELMRTTRIATHPAVVKALEERDDDLQQQDDAAARAAELEAATRRWETRDAALIRAVTDGKLADLLKQQVARPDETAGPILPAATRAATRALFLTDSTGTLVAATHADVRYAHADESWWRHAYQNGVGQPHLGNIAFDERLGVYVFHLSVPVMDSIRYRAIGVLHRVFDAKEYLGPSLFPIRFGNTGHVMLIDSNGVVMLCPILPTGVKLADADLVVQVTPLNSGWVKASTDGHGGDSTSIIGYSALPGTSRLTRQSTGATWHTFVWQASEELFAPTRHFFGWVAGFGLVALSLLAALGYVASVRIVTPIRHLQESATLIGRGELVHPISIRTGDELEQLADEMNRMNAQLMQTFSGLSDTVEEQAEEVRSLQVMNQQILESVPNPIVLLGQDGQVDYLNRAAHQAFASVGRAIGLPLDALLGLDPTSAQRLKTEWAAQRDGVLPGQPAVAVEEVRDPLAPTPAMDWHHGGSELRIAPRIYRYQWFRIRAPRDEQIRIGLMFQDTTDERVLQEKVVQAEKSSGLSLLASGIGHELNNPLSGILGLSEAIVDESDLAVIKDHARTVVEQAKRMADVIHGLASHTGNREGNRPVKVELNALLEDVIAQLRATEGAAGLDVRTHYGPACPVHARPEEIRQVLINVLTNAVQAMNGHGQLRIATEADNMGQVAITIGDSGCGIPPAYLPKVFDPFFTTKRQGQGRGLGLTTARRIVESLGGEIGIASQAGQGTTVRITFPVADFHPSRTVS